MVLLLNAPALVIIGSTLEGTHTRADRHIQPRYGHTLSPSSASSSRYLTNKLLSKASSPSSSIERHAWSTGLSLTRPLTEDN